MSSVLVYAQPDDLEVLVGFLVTAIHYLLVVVGAKLVLVFLFWFGFVVMFFFFFLLLGI